MDCIKKAASADGSLFVDDLSLGCAGSSLDCIERQLQSILRALQTWCDENGFKFEPKKTICVHFTRKHNLVRQPDLYLNNIRIPVKTEAKFLGIWFDNKLTFKFHINYLIKKCTKAINLLKTVAHKDWGGDRTVLLRLYRSLIRSKLDYGSIIYGSAAKTHLNKIDVVAHTGLRIALGAFRTSPIESLYAEAGEPPLALRREQLATQYAVRVSQYPDNPVNDCIFNFPFSDEYAKLIPTSTLKPPFGFRVKPLLEEINFDKDNIFECKPINSPWCRPKPEIDWSLTQFKKSETTSEIFLSKFLEIKASYAGYQEIYTDGSKSDDAVAFAALYQDFDFSCEGRLPPISSVFSAELFAIYEAFWIIKNSHLNHFVIFSDSKSSLEALTQMEPTNPVVCGLLKKYNKLLKDGKTLKFCWVPSHIGIPGNEAVDSLAKEALDKEDVHLDILQIVASDYKHPIRQRLKQKHQSYFDGFFNNKLKQIQPKINYNTKVGVHCRKDEMVVTRLKIGHTYFTNGYLLRDEDPPYCQADDCTFTVKHILTECSECVDERRRYLNIPNYSDIFKKQNLSNLIKFIKSIWLYNYI